MVDHPLPVRALGETGLQVSALGLGTVKLGRDQGVKYPTRVRIPDDREAAQLLKQALDLGITLLDTAPAYGNSEERLGSLLRGQRNNWVLCTKVGEEFADGKSTHDFSPEHCRFSVTRSLRRLHTDVIDIVLIHSNGDDLDILQRQGTLQALIELRDSGLIRAVGISHKSVAGAELAVEQGADVLMATLNREEMEDAPVIAAAAQRGCGVLIKKALSSGYGNAADLGWVAAQPGVHSIVVGTTSPAHLADNVAAISGGSVESG